MYNNTQIQLQLKEYCLPLTCVYMQCAHYVWVLKEGLLAVSYGFSCIAYLHTYSMHTKLTKMLATNQYDTANWFMHTRVTCSVHM